MLRVWVVAGLALLIGWSPALADRKKDKKDKDKAKEEPAVVAPVDPVEAEYRRYVEEGLREFNAANYEEALALFDKAYAVKPTARVLRGIGKVQFELKQYAKAVGTLDAALASTADPLADTLREEVTSLRERALRFTGVVKAKVVPATAGRIALSLKDGRIRLAPGDQSVRINGHPAVSDVELVVTDQVHVGTRRYLVEGVSTHVPEPVTVRMAAMSESIDDDAVGAPARGDRGALWWLIAIAGLIAALVSALLYYHG